MLAKIYSYCRSIFAVIMVISLGQVNVNAIEWPQEVAEKEGTIVVYQPQPESLSGNILQGRAAMSLELIDRDEPIFGAFWFSARIDTNADNATVRDVKVTQVRWPESTATDEQRFTEVVEKALGSSSFNISMERLSASLANAKQEKQSLENIKNDAPNIIFRQQLSVLLSFDGSPQFREIENSPYERALNTPFAVARNKLTKKLYLSSGTFWYTADNPMGPWQVTEYPPEDLVNMIPKSDDAMLVKSSAAPAVIAVKTATELVATDGKPRWKSLTAGKLLYVSNTETAWIREVASGDMYLLLSGRWFQAKKEAGPWAFIRADKLPTSFNDIPPESDIGGLRVSVAGTTEAEQAMLDAQIPQTAAIKRSEAKLTVEYDGEPKFDAIPGTKVAYAVNTATQVLKINGQYYAVDNAVWFVASAAKGPWKVADNVPTGEIAKIPPSSPVYNTTYVEIYDSTPEIVYVGYTPGYMWSYPYYGVPVYGTGWYYPPYWGRYYYPRPPTWGLHVGYNPWTGWNVGVSWSNGFFRVGVGWNAGWGNHHYPSRCCGGYYGGGYRRPVVINTGDINIGNSVSIGNRTNISNRVAKNNLSGNRVGENNLYNHPENRIRNADPKRANDNIRQATHNKSRTNNVFADKNGNIARDNNGQWQSRSKGSWTPAPETKQRVEAGLNNRDTSKPITMPSRPNTDMSRPTNINRQINNHNFDREGLNRSRSARQHGVAREGRRGR
ncbi:carbohydrate-binding family V/XII [Shewanella sp. KX20019]|uniref:carbohydrate-binding family V/XII n=1 Tax=Shewanella sp. KX20019 TaxID=2803864 RepID=UPI0019293520|nr:carbohydrate-binding family V/XII [Shewanella sp. KX20019]QQX79918.1 carbohydrate-binding family V/XII [Shewanella sp. KX20019]